MTPLELMTHLWAQYHAGKFSAKDLTSNWARMNAQWTPPTAIENLFKQLLDGQIFARQGGETISDSQFLRLGYDLVLATGLFEMSCREWRLKLPAEKTLRNFQVFFTDADADRRDNNQTAANAGYSANVIQDLIHNEINNIIAEHTIEEPPQSKPAVPFLPIAPSQESANASLTIDQVCTLLQELMPQQQSQQRTRSNGNCTSLPRINNNRCSSTNNNTRGGAGGPQIAQGYDANGTAVSYCWTHGITTNLNHTSHTCTRQSEGHKHGATFAHHMNGSNERQGPSTTRTPPTSA